MELKKNRSGIGICQGNNEDNRSNPKRRVKITHPCYFSLVKIPYSFTCENNIFIYFGYTVIFTACDKIKILRFNGDLKTEHKKTINRTTIDICLDTDMPRAKQGMALSLHDEENEKGYAQLVFYLNIYRTVIGPMTVLYRFKQNAIWDGN